MLGLLALAPGVRPDSNPRRNSNRDSIRMFGPDHDPITDSARRLFEVCDELLHTNLSIPIRVEQM